MIDWRKQTKKKDTKYLGLVSSGWSCICGLPRCGKAQLPSHCRYRAPRVALLELHQQSGYVCWRSEQHPTIYFYLFFEVSFWRSMHSRFQLKEEQRLQVWAEGWCRICTGAGSVFVNLSHMSILWQQMWCCIAGHDFRRTAGCVEGMPLYNDLPTCKLSK